MGKRKKASKPQGPKKREPLATTFACLFCNHEKSISCKLDKKASVGTLACKVCGQTFQTDINALSAPVDVYSDWIDACDAVTRENGGASGDHYGGETYRRKDVPESGGSGGAGRAAAEDEEELDEEDF